MKLCCHYDHMLLLCLHHADFHCQIKLLCQNFSKNSSTQYLLSFQNVCSITRNNYILLRSGLSSGCGFTSTSMSYVLTPRLKPVQYWQIHFWKGSGGEPQYIPLLSCTDEELQFNVAGWCPCFNLVMVVSTHSLYSYKNCQRRSYLLLSCFHNYNNTSWLISSACGLLTHSQPDSRD